MKQELKKYEIGFLARNESGGGDINQLLTAHKCEIIEVGSNLDRIKLSYPIKKETSGYFGYIHFSAEPSMVEKIIKELNLNSNILRFIIITPPSEKQPVLAEKVEMKKKELPAKETEIKTDFKKTSTPPVLTNEALEQKLEEILK